VVCTRVCVPGMRHAGLHPRACMRACSEMYVCVCVCACACVCVCIACMHGMQT
jgi:hypothetical protein